MMSALYQVLRPVDFSHEKHLNSRNLKTISHQLLKMKKNPANRDVSFVSWSSAYFLTHSFSLNTLDGLEVISRICTFVF